MNNPNNNQINNVNNNNNFNNYNNFGNIQSNQDNKINSNPSQINNNNNNPINNMNNNNINNSNNDSHNLPFNSVNKIDNNQPSSNDKNQNLMNNMNNNNIANNNMNNINNNNIQSNAALNMINSNNPINNNFISNININSLNNQMSNPNIKNQNQMANNNMQLSNIINLQMNSLINNNSFNNNNNQQNNINSSFNSIINNNNQQNNINNNNPFNNNNFNSDQQNNMNNNAFNNNYGKDSQPNNMINNPQMIGMNNNQMINMNSNNPQIKNNRAKNASFNEMNKNNNNINNPINQNVNNKDNNPPPNKEKYSFSRYKKAAKTGLSNMGDTSYLNAVLQLLGTVRNLASYFVNPNNQKFFVDNINNASLSFVIHRLFLHLYPYPEKEQQVYKPETLLTILGKLNQVYNSKKRRNPNDLILFILNHVHKEINLIKIKYMTNVNHMDKDIVIKTGFEDFQKSNKSIISNNFFWFEFKSQKCNLCNKIFYYLSNYETFELELDYCYNMNIMNNNNAPLTIEKCMQIQSQQKRNVFCEVCKSYQQMDVNIRIYSSPNYFVFSLNRENTSTNLNLLNIPFLVEQFINIGQFLEFNQSYTKFELGGIVSFSRNENKYVCFGKSPVDSQWYLYNDEKVDDINIENILNLHNNSQAYVPCILSYKFNQ